MRMYIIPAALAATLSIASLAFAAPQQAIGTIKSFDSKAMTLRLDNGSTFTLPKDFKNPGLKAGEKVSVAWEMSGKSKTAESVEIVK